MWLGWKQVFLRPLFAGALIGLGGAIYLTIGGIVGAVAFAFGLMGVIHYGAPLYTGMAGFINVKDKFAWIMLLITLIGNFIGCWLVDLYPARHRLWIYHDCRSTGRSRWKHSSHTVRCSIVHTARFLPFHCWCLLHVSVVVWFYWRMVGVPMCGSRKLYWM